MMDDSFYPAVTGPVVQQVGAEDVPQGGVVQDLYNPIEIDADPAADSLRQTPILNLDVEVHVAALRAAYPDMYPQIKASASSVLSDNSTIDRIARQQIYSQTYGRTDILSDQKPTLSRTWIQPWAFDLEDDQEFGKRMRTAFPAGCLLINTGETFLNAKEADLNKEWTWAGTHEKFKMFPPCPGDVVVPFQEVYNDLASIMREGIDRGFNGLIFGNDDLIGGKSMQGKPPLAGIINPIKLKRTGAPGSFKLQDAIWQFQIELKIREGMEYCKAQMMNAQMFAMVPPQVYGGQGDPAIETAQGQKQQLGTAMGVLNIYWENLREEHAQQTSLRSMCAKDNLTDDVLQVIEEKGGWQNQYVRLDDLQGSVMPTQIQTKACRYPLLNCVSVGWTSCKLRTREPSCAVNLRRSYQPGAGSRCSWCTGHGSTGIGNAQESAHDHREVVGRRKPIPVIDPQTGQPAVDQTGQPQLQPSIMPTKGIDDNPDAAKVLKQTVWQYCQEKPQIADDKPMGFRTFCCT